MEGLEAGLKMKFGYCCTDLRPCSSLFGACSKICQVLIPLNLSLNVLREEEYITPKCPTYMLNCRTLPASETLNELSKVQAQVNSDLKTSLLFTLSFKTVFGQP